jgi:hypothetical protein
LAISASALLALILATGIFAQPQAEAVVAFAAINHYEPCEASWMGEGLFDVAGPNRKALHDEEWPSAYGGVKGCVSPERQVAFMVRHWQDRPCRRIFDAGDLSAFKRCWGWGKSH